MITPTNREIKIMNTNTSHWTDNFVTFDKAADEWVAWDETGSDELGRFGTRDEAVHVCEDYAAFLDDLSQ